MFKHTLVASILSHLLHLGQMAHGGLSFITEASMGHFDLMTEDGLISFWLFLYRYIIHAFSETKICSPESTNAAFSALPTTTYVNGVSPNPPSSEDALSPKSSPHQMELLAQTEIPASQPSLLAKAHPHQLLSIHHTLFEEEEDADNRTPRLTERPGELIAAGEC